MNFGCWHRFGRWQTPFNSSEAKEKGKFGDYSLDSVVMQERECEKCHIVISRVVRSGKVREESDG